MASLNEELASLLEASGNSHKMKSTSVHALTTNVFQISGSSNGSFLEKLLEGN